MKDYYRSYKALKPKPHILSLFSLALSFACLVCTTTVQAQQPTLLKDINVDFGESGPTKMLQIGSIFYFEATTPESGNELWKSDGTEAGTVLVKDINSGTYESSINTLTALNGELYFRATDGIAGLELWKSDGTEAGTVLVKDINSGSANSSPANFIGINNILYFSANDGSNGIELWKSDGTEAGTVLVKDIRTGGLSSSPANFQEFNGELYFLAKNAVNGEELWKSDGTEAGTVLLKDINSGSGNSSPVNLFKANNLLYFQADDGNTGEELWKSDGTEAGTVLVKDINNGSADSSPKNFIEVNNILYFLADNGSNGAELWKSDGTEAGTVLLKDINSGSDNSFPLYPVELNGELIFRANDGSNGFELWKSDGTEAGTVLVKDINSGSLSSSPSELIKLNGNVYFRADVNSTGTELWKSDGTEAGTVLVKDIKSGTGNGLPRNFIGLNNNLYFRATDGLIGEELWKSDGTEAGTVLVKDIYNGSASSTPEYITKINDELYFSAQNAVNGTELWKSDGTEAGTVLVKDIRNGSQSSSPKYLTEVNAEAYFSANSTFGKELWKSDGTEAGTVLVKDIVVGGSGSSPLSLTEVNDALYFTAFENTSGRELWKSDGTEAGTILVKDIRGGTNSSSLDNFIEFNDELYFSATDGTAGAELWKSDGTEAGTVLLKDIRSGGLGSAPYNFQEFNSELYFSAQTVNSTKYLWKSDGTEAGTVLVKDFTGGEGGYPENLTVHNGELYFSADSGTDGRELWKSDGTTSGTVLLKDIYSGASSSTPTNLTTYNGELYFSANDGTNGIEIWKTDGTTAGTVLLKDINSGSSNSLPTNFKVINDTLYFTAFDAANAQEIWKTDGTTAGTVQAYTSNTTFAGINSLNLVDKNLVFNASTNVYGSELFVLPIPIPEINVQGNSVDIQNGDDSPSTADNTDFGLSTLNVANPKTFSIQNVGTKELNITSITSTNSDFVITNIPTVITPNSHADITVTLTATTSSSSATLTILSDDPSNGTFTFDVTGCDALQTWYIDADGDDYGASSVSACARPTNGFLLNELAVGSTGIDDCDDTDANINPSTVEITGWTSGIESCAGYGDGRFSIISVNAEGPVQYSLSGGTFQIDTFFADLSVGMYSVYIKDVHGCISDPISTEIFAGPTAPDATMTNIGTSDCIAEAILSVPADPNIHSLEWKKGTSIEHVASGSPLNYTYSPTMEGDWTVIVKAHQNCIVNSSDTITLDTIATWYIDADNDNYGASSTTACERPVNGKLLTELVVGSTGTDDCDDTDAGINPATIEVVDGADQNCNALIDDVLTSITIANISASDCKNTTCTSDDTFTADVTVFYSDKPVSGSLSLSGATLTNAISADVSTIGATSHTFTGVSLSADGQSYGLTATFSALPAVPYSEADIATAPDCSGNVFALGGCPDGMIWLDFAQASPVNNAPAWVIDLGGDIVEVLWTGTEWQVVQNTTMVFSTNTTGTSAYPPCTGWSISNGCGIFAMSGLCGQSLDCSVSSITASNASACNSNSTSTSSDDYFTADVKVDFTYAPSSGNLTLKRGSTVIATKDASELACLTSWTFSAAQIAADGADVMLTAEFNSGCTMTTGVLMTAPVACSCPTITANVNWSDEFCADANNGSIFINNVVGGTAPYTYSIGGNFSQMAFFGFVPDGNYTVVVKDANGCESAGSLATIAAGPTAPNASVSNSGASACVGEAVLSIPANAAISSIHWYNGNTLVHTEIFNPTGSYSYTPTSNGDYKAIVSVPPACSVTSSTTFQVTGGTTWYADTDTDGYGDPNNSSTDCIQPNGFVADNTDCDDTDINEFPGQTWYIDADSDTYGGSSMTACERPTDGFLLSELAAGSTGMDDCDDTESTVYPNAPELCDHLDNDCNGTVDDGAAPVITCPDPVYVAADANCAGTMPDITGLASVTDDCDPNPIVTQSPAVPLTLNVPVTVTLTATDSTNLIDDCMVMLTLVDSTGPVLTCPGPLMTVNSPGSCNQNVSWNNPSAMDNCGNATIPMGTASGVFIINFGQQSLGLFPGGTTTVTYSAADIAGNIGTCSFDVTVEDTEPPAITGCPTNAPSAYTAFDECGAQVGWPPIYPNDNCSATMTASHNPGDNFPVGMTPVLYIATDPGGLKDTCEFNVVVLDTFPPVVTCRADTVEMTIGASGNIALIADDFVNTVTDNCIQNVTLSLYNPIIGCLDTGIQEVILIANDNDMLYDSCSAYISVTDEINPVARCNSNPLDVVLDVNGMATITPQQIGGQSSDNCSIDTMTLDVSTFGCLETGLNSVLLTVTDASGNTAACAASVNVIDNIAPTAVCIDTVMQLVLDANGMVSITANDIDDGSSDNCAFTMTIDNVATLIPIGDLTFDCSDAGTNYVELTVTDASGNTALCSAQISVSDTIAPTAVCIDTVMEVSLGFNGLVTIAANDIDNGSADNCTFSMAIVNNDPSPFSPTSGVTFDCNETGMNTVNLTVTDASSNTATCSAQVNVSDDINPDAKCISAPLNVVLDANGMATITAQDINNNSLDNCSIASMALDNTTFDCNETGLNSVNLTVTDDSGNTDDCSAQVNVIDNIVPTAVCIDTTMEVSLDANGMASITADDIDDGSADNCGFTMTIDDFTPDPPLLPTSGVSYDCNDSGINFVELTVTDASGNTAVCTAQVTVSDTITPTAVCIDTVMEVSLDANGMASITADDIDDGSADNCRFAMTIRNTSATPLTPVNGENFDCMEIGINTINLTVTDASLNSSTCSAQVNVSDNINPDAQCITAPLDVILDVNGLATISPQDIDNNSSDNCSIASMTLDSTTFDCLETGLNIVNLTVTDASGNTAVCYTQVNVIDNISPMAVCIDTIMQIVLDANGKASITVNDIDDGSSDNCAFTMAINHAVINPAAPTPGLTFDCTYEGYNYVELTTTDASSNSDNCYAQVLVIDNINPTAICIDTVMEINLDANGMAMITADDIDDGSFDNCDFTMTIDTSTFDCLDLGMHTITLTATDNSSGSSSLVAVSGNSCTAQVNVFDNMNPTAQCITSTLDVILDVNGMATITTTDIDNSSSDNCSIASMTLDSTAFDCMETGINSVNLTVTDDSGNSAACSATINVIDNINPTAVCIDTTMQIYLNANGMVLIKPEDIDDGSVDNCTFSMAIDSSAFDCMETGMNLVNLTVTDASGNSDACSATVNVSDNINPTAICISTLNIYLDANGTATINPSDISDGSFDNCSIAMMELDSTAFDCAEVGMNPVQLTLTDASGNTNTCSAMVNVLDTISPTNLTCPDDMSISSTSTSCQGSAGWVIPTWSDNCSVSDVQFSASGASVFPLGANAFGTFPGGTTTVSYAAVDNGGNSTVCSFDIIVTDQVFPTFAGCPSIVNAVSTAGQCSAQVFWSPPSGSDNCPGFMVTQSHFPAQNFDVGTTTVTYTVTDVSDNTAHCTFDVVVTDGTAPTLTCPADITVTAPSGSCNAVVNFAAPTATDDCDNSVIPVHVEGPASGMPVNIGTSSSLWSATDSAGNSVNCNISITVLSGDVWYADVDGDGYGDDAVSQTGCIQPMDYVAVGGDCDDTDAAINPDAVDICDGIDNDCDGIVDNLNGCERPTTITALPLTNTTATITWTAMCGATKYDLRYRPFVPGVAVRHIWHKDLTSNTFDLDNLTYGTIYQIQVRTHCGTGVSTFRTVYITTEATPSCVTPVFTSATAGATTIDLAWPDVGATFQRIMWKAHGPGTWNIANIPVGTTSYQITGLNPNTKYRYMIRVKCGGPWAPYNAFNLITTTAAPPSMGRTADEKPIATMRAYPNPFQDGFRIETDMIGMKQIAILSSQGRLLSTWQDDEQSIRIDMAGMPSGLYIIELKDKNGSVLRERMVKTDR